MRSTKKLILLLMLLTNNFLLVHAQDDPEKQALRAEIEQLNQNYKAAFEDRIRALGERIKKEQEAIIARENLVRYQNEANEKFEARVKEEVEKLVKDKDTAVLQIKLTQARHSAEQCSADNIEARKHLMASESLRMDQRTEFEKTLSRNQQVLASLANLHGNYSTADLIPAFTNLLDNKSWGGRWQTLISLGEIGPDAKAALPKLADCMKDDDALVRILAAESMWKIEKNSQHVAGVLLESLKKDAVTRGTCAAILSRIGAEDAGIVASLADELTNKDEDVAWAAGMALRRIGKNANAATHALKAATKDERKRVALIAAEALKEIEK